MPDSENRITAGTVVKFILLALACLIVAAVVYLVAVMNGRAPLPERALNMVATKMDMPAEEREFMNKALDIYEILRASEAGADLRELRKMASRDASDEEVAEKLSRSYYLLSDQDLEEIRRVLEVEPEDFSEGKAILDRGMAAYSRTGEFALSDEDGKALKALGEKYGLSEENLEEWSSSN